LNEKKSRREAVTLELNSWVE